MKYTWTSIRYFFNEFYPDWKETHRHEAWNDYSLAMIALSG